jgi:2-oxoisovalerate dehydrogenase E1 component
MGRVTAGPDEHFRAAVASWAPAPGRAERNYDELLELFEAQALSRHLDLEARRLFAAGEGFYTIGWCRTPTRCATCCWA